MSVEFMEVVPCSGCRLCAEIDKLPMCLRRRRSIASPRCRIDAELHEERLPAGIVNDSGRPDEIRCRAVDDMGETRKRAISDQSRVLRLGNREARGDWRWANRLRRRHHLRAS